ncbi:MAG: ferritin-like domain-containing protein [Oscillochloris sp.]|nr:ferritin-like domain-containing protein [Oscillochloris sp.]
MSQNKDEIRNEIEDLRVSIRNDLDQIEDRVRGMRQLPQEARERLFERLFKRPLIPVGVATIAGFLLGRVGGKRKQYRSYSSAAHSDGMSFWLRMALIALFVNVLYDAARTALRRAGEQGAFARIRLPAERNGYGLGHVRFSTQVKENHMATPRDTLVSWLRDAHGLETNLVQTLEKHADQAKGHPQIEAKMREHLEQTKRHADLIEGCLKRYNERPSGVKEAIGAVSGFMQGITSGAAADNMVKNALADYAAEHFEIASYRSLRSAAQHLGDDETVRICDQILRDEESMASWLEQQIPQVTQMYLGEQAREAAR